MFRICSNSFEIGRSLCSTLMLIDYYGKGFIVHDYENIKIKSELKENIDVYKNTKFTLEFEEYLKSKYKWGMRVDGDYNDFVFFNEIIATEAKLLML